MGNPAKPDFIPPGFGPGDVTYHNVITEWHATNPAAMYDLLFRAASETLRDVAADPKLTEALATALAAGGGDVRTGRTWSTDAPYRETREEAISYQAEGVLTVDMEMAALLAVAEARAVAAAGVLVVGDSLAGGTWRPPERLDEMERSLARAYRAAIEVLDGR
jgi:purine-nucleoside phosphorylase